MILVKSRFYITYLFQNLADKKVSLKIVYLNILHDLKLVKNVFTCNCCYYYRINQTYT